MVKHIQTIRPLLATNCLSVFDHFVRLAINATNCLSVFDLFVGLALKGLKCHEIYKTQIYFHVRHPKLQRLN